MLDNEPDTNTEPDTTDHAGGETPPVTKPPRRRRAASRPAGPPAAAPASIVVNNPVADDAATDRLAPDSPTQTNSSQTDSTQTDSSESDSTQTAEAVTEQVPAKRAPAKRAPRKTAARKTAASADEQPTLDAADGEAPAPRTRAPRKRAAKKTSAASTDPTVVEPAVAADLLTPVERPVTDPDVVESPVVEPAGAEHVSSSPTEEAPVETNDAADAEIALDESEAPAVEDSPPAHDQSSDENGPDEIAPDQVVADETATHTETSADSADQTSAGGADQTPADDELAARTKRLWADPFAVPEITPRATAPSDEGDMVDASAEGASIADGDVSGPVNHDGASDESEDDESDDDSDDESDADGPDDQSNHDDDGAPRRRRRRRGGRRHRRSGSDDESSPGPDSTDHQDNANNAKSSDTQGSSNTRGSSESAGGAGGSDSSDDAQGSTRRTGSDASTAESNDEPGRRRSRSRNAPKTDHETPDDGDPQDNAATDTSSGRSHEDASDSDEEDSSGQGRRRRRRRRRGEDSGAAADDPSEVVVRVREPRARAKPASETEVTGITGSTRMEAKRQRRREGREAGRRRAPILSEAEFLTRRESVNRTMVIRQDEDLSQIAVIEDDILVEHYVDRDSATSLIGNVYLGRVQNVLPSMEAAFIDIGRGRNAVLYAGEIDWDSFGAEGHNRKVERVLKSGQTILVQVSKDPVGAKGARLTNHVSIPGRYIVYAPGGHLSGISRKLPENERRRLKDILHDLVGDTASVIVRTAAEGASEEELVRDVNRLKAQWQDIEGKIKAGNAPQLLYGEPDLTVRIVRDLFTEDFSDLLIQGNGLSNDAYEAVQGYVTHVAPHLADRMHLWNATENGDIFTAHRLDEQIAKGLERKVFLPSGGSLIIDRTEAMTVIDVNTGKFTGTGGNLEATVTSNNLEAAEEIVRQLRLRDIGGIIVIDFIDMVLPNNRELLIRRLVECLGRDRTRHQVAEVTSLGLVQMTRKKLGTGLLEAFTTECEHCHGRGVELHDMPVETQKQADGGARDQRPGDRRGRPNGGGQSNGSNQGGSNQGGSNQSGSNQSGSNQSGSNQGGSNQGGGNRSGENNRGGDNSGQSGPGRSGGGRQGRNDGGRGRGGRSRDQDSGNDQTTVHEPSRESQDLAAEAQPEPVETPSVESQRVVGSPVEAQRVEASPADSQHVVSSPVEAQYVDASRIESQHAESAPVESPDAGKHNASDDHASIDNASNDNASNDNASNDNAGNVGHGSGDGEQSAASRRGRRGRGAARREQGAPNPSS